MGQRQGLAAGASPRPTSQMSRVLSVHALSVHDLLDHVGPHLLLALGVLVAGPLPVSSSCSSPGLPLGPLTAPPGWRAAAAARGEQSVGEAAPGLGPLISTPQDCQEGSRCPAEHRKRSSDTS